MLLLAAVAGLAAATASPALAEEEPIPAPTVPAPDPAPPAPAPAPPRPAPRPPAPRPTPPPAAVTPTPTPSSTQVEPAASQAPAPAVRRPRAVPKPKPKPRPSPEPQLRRLPIRDSAIVRLESGPAVLGAFGLVSERDEGNGPISADLVLALWFGLAAALLATSLASPFVAARDSRGLTLYERRGAMAVVGINMVVAPIVGYALMVALS